MRDIRSDLEERAKILQGQIKTASAQYEKLMQQLQSERDARIAELTEALGMIDKLMQFESSIEDKVVTLPPNASAGTPPAPTASAAAPSAANTPAKKNSSLIDRIRSVNA